MQENELVGKFIGVFFIGNILFQAYEQKNIRRRVYDAINVLLAMNIIVKDKKDIRWVGFPVNALFECELIDVRKSPSNEFSHFFSFQIEKNYRNERNNSRESSIGRTSAIKSKGIFFIDNILLLSFQQIALRNLIRRNELHRDAFNPHHVSLLPFFAFGTSNGAMVESSFSRDGYVERGDFERFDQSYLVEIRF